MDNHDRTSRLIVAGVIVVLLILAAASIYGRVLFIRWVVEG